MTYTMMYMGFLLRCIGPGEFYFRWAFIAGCALLVAINFRIMGVEIAPDSLEERLTIPVVFSVIAVLLLLVQNYTGRLSAILVDFFLSVAQITTASLVLVAMTFVASSWASSVPLLDAKLAHLDKVLFGVNVLDMVEWLSMRPYLETTLNWAYLSWSLQCSLLILMGSIMNYGDRNRELTWLFLCGLSLTIICSIFTPALGHSGLVGNAPMDFVKSIRAGEWDTFDYRKLEGIITFPSFHITGGVFWTYYAARLDNRFLILFAPLNLVMFVAVPPCGGHYVIDIIGGLLVAAISIAIVRWAERLRSGRLRPKEVALQPVYA